MPTAMTFDSLQTDVRGYLERGDSTDAAVYDQIPRLINMAERRIARDLRILGFQEVVEGTVTANNPVLAKPERWKETISINIGIGTSNDERSPVSPRGYEFARAYWPDQTQTGRPLFYSEYNYDNWLLTPTPDDTYPIEILYYASPRLLDDTVGTNWLTEQLPNALLYGTLLEASPFIMNDERIPVWKAFYTEAIQGTDAEDVRRMADRSATRQEV